MKIRGSQKGLIAGFILSLTLVFSGETLPVENELKYKPYALQRESLTHKTTCYVSRIEWVCVCGGLGGGEGVITNILYKCIKCTQLSIKITGRFLSWLFKCISKCGEKIRTWIRWVESGVENASVLCQGHISLLFRISWQCLHNIYWSKNQMFSSGQKSNWYNHNRNHLNPKACFR